LFFLFCAPIHSLPNYSIVFIHLGKSIPAYTEIAISQAREFNPNASIILLANQEALASFNCGPDRKCISCESLVRSKNHEDFLAQTSLDSSSRDGIWLYSSERFLYLDELMAQHGLQDVFHMEYDNMLYADLGELLPVFQSRYQGIAATFDNDGRCIPGFLYVKNSEAMNRLAKSFSDHAKENLFDMHLIAAFKNENHDGVIDHLPIITQEYIDEHPLVTPSGLAVVNKAKYAQNIDAFKSVFDAAALGQFLGGIDPRNDVSVPGFINESCVFNPSSIKIEWIVDEQNRRAPYVVYPHAKYRINNLHIHSKYLERFKSREAL
jgi:hypothetical protein